MTRRSFRPLSAAFCLACALLAAGCRKRPAEPLPEPSVEETSATQPMDTLSVFSPDEVFTEPESGSAVSLGLVGRLSCPPLPVRGALACARGKEIILLESDGTSRSAAMPENCESLIGAYETGESAYILVSFRDGSLACLDSRNLEIKAERPKATETALYALSGLKLLCARGKTIERLSLPSLQAEESAGCPALISLIASNGSECLVFSGGAGIQDARFLEADDLQGGAGDMAASPAVGEAPKEENAGRDGNAVWLATFGSGFIVLFDDGRAAFLEKGEEAEYLEGSFDARLGGIATASRAALVRPNGKLCFISLGSEERPKAEDTDIFGETAMPVSGGWLRYGSGRLGYSRSSGAPLWETGLAEIPIYRPFVWNNRIVVCARDGLFLFPGFPDSRLESLLSEALISPEAVAAISPSLDSLRSIEKSAEGGETPHLELETYRKGIRKAFGKIWRISVFVPGESLSHRLSVKGKGAYFILVFDEDGGKIVSNQGYELEDHIDLGLAKGKKYAVAFAPRESSADGEPAELSITAR